MSINWTKAKKQIATFMKHIEGLPKNTPRAYTLTVEEIDRILKQRKGKRLDGIRIYLGAEIKKGIMVPNIIVVGCEKAKDGQLNDYNVPQEMPKKSAAKLLSSPSDAEPGVAEIRPCPDWCGGKNILNP